MVTVSLKRKCLGNSQSTTNISLNFCISSHVVQSQTHKLNPKDFSWLVMRLGCKQIMVFLGCKSLSSRIAFILRSTFFSFILSLLLAFQYLQHFVSLSFNNNTHSAFILEFFAFFFFILAAFTCFFFILLSVLLFVLPYLLSPNNLPPNLGQICFEP